MTRNPDQYTLDFTSAAGERCALLAGLRDACLPIHINYGRVEGVIELLQRLVLFAQYLPQQLASDFTVDAQVAYLATRMPSRVSVDPRTIRRWAQDAAALGCLSVRINSHLRGGRSWNTYTVHFGRVLELIQSGRTRADMGGHDVRPIGRTQCPPLRADTMSAPNRVTTKENTNYSPAASSSEGTNPPSDCERERVVSALLDLGMSERGTDLCVTAATKRGLTYDQIHQLIELYRELEASPNRDPRMHVGWLSRWIDGQSRPPTPEAAPKPNYDQQTIVAQKAFVRKEALRYEIVSAGRRANASEELIQQRLKEAGIDD